MLEFDIPYKFKPRPYQVPLLKALDNGCKRAVIAWSRGAGKDLCAMNYIIKRAFQHKGVYLHCFPNYNQAKRAIWKSVHETGSGESISYLDHIPPELIKSKNSSEMTIELINGSIYCVLGVDGKNAQRARGMNPTGVIMSEYAFMDETAWTTIEPRVKGNNGIAIFVSTPNGQNHFYTLFNHAKANPDDYFSSLITIKDVGIIGEDHIEDLRKRGVPEDFIQQEYFCSFTRGAEGSYYGKLIQKARDDGRICDLLIDKELPVYTAWDLGVGDSTSIWWFQIKPNGAYHFLNYYENHGEGVKHYIDKINQFREDNGITYLHHYAPHDIGVTEFSAGDTRLNIAREFGINFIALERKKIEDGIQAVRSLLPNCYFNGQTCLQGIQCLDFYRKKWNEAMKVYYDTPQHDKHSHGADAFRYAAMGIRTHGGYGGSIDDDMNALSKYWGR
jgi:phage terminase large subunit